MHEKRSGEERRGTLSQKAREIIGEGTDRRDRRVDAPYCEKCGACGEDGCCPRTECHWYGEFAEAFELASVWACKPVMADNGRTGGFTVYGFALESEGDGMWRASFGIHTATHRKPERAIMLALEQINQ